MTAKVDFKKEHKDLYLPKRRPVLIDVPQMQFLMVDGAGDPNSEAYQQAIGILYGLTFTIKMSKMSGKQPPGYYDYVVPPLEGLWWIAGGAFSLKQRENWLWISMIRQPEFVTPAVFDWAVEECGRKNRPSSPGYPRRKRPRKFRSIIFHPHPEPSLLKGEGVF